MSAKERTYYGLTHPQKRIWYIDKINLSHSLHNICACLNINGTVSVDIMKKAINLAIRNNDGIRLRLTEIDGQPMQYLDEFYEQDIDFLDFSKYDSPEKSHEMWLEKMLREHFELCGGSLFYFAVYKTGDEKYGVLLKVHHIISDGWACSLIENQVCEFYNNLIRGEDIAPNGNYSYINYIQDEKEYLDSERFRKNKTFWNEKLNNPPEEFLYNMSASVEGRRRSCDIDISLSGRIKNVLDEKKCSLNTFFIAAVLIYMHKITNKEDLVLGTAVYNRTGRVQRRMVGMFTSTMPFRFLLNPEMNIGDLLDQLNNELKRCFINQKYPYDLLVKDLKLTQSHYDSLFKITVNYYNMNLSNEIDGADASVHDYYSGSQGYSMQIIAREWGKGHITLDFDYKTQEYTELEIDTMQKSIINILEQITKNEELVIKNIKLVNEDERNYRLYDFNATQCYYPHKTVYQLFEEQVARHPEKIALIFRGIKLTYRELNEKANRLAHYLIEKGVGQGAIVSILQTHSPELVISILAVLKSEGVYLPIDPNYPDTRINYMLENSQCKLLLTNYEINDAPFDVETIDVSCIDSHLFSEKNLSRKNSMDDLAYIIYTSGSTGAPKGVMIRHKGLTNYIWWANKTYFKSENESMALYSSIAFDLTVTSIFTPLISGDSIVIYDHDENEHVLYKMLREDKVTIIKLTPAHLDLLRGTDYSYSGVKSLIVGGDDLKVSLAKEISDGFGSVEIYNEYGPTETVVGCMIHKFDAKNDTRGSVPIGCPIDNAQIYILNEELDVTPVGLPGELYISGDGVSLGYFNNDELTREKFVNNPFVVGQKMYKTGDMARYLENDIIEYIGRTDNQIKIRGHRIEIGEIEKCLTKMESIINAAVAMKKDSNGNDVLNAYVVVSSDISDKELRSWLSKSLPYYMIPSNFVFMSELPLTINGKIDFSSLPEAEKNKNEFEQSETTVEKELVAVMSEVLCVDTIGMSDNFYQLGGDSIKAIQISSKLNNMGYSIKSKEILTYDTIREIADGIEITNNALPSQGITHGSFGQTPIIKWFFEQQFDCEGHYNQSILLKLKEHDIDEIKKAMLQLLWHHDTLRLNYNRTSGELYYNNEIPDVEVEYFDLSIHPECIKLEQIKEQGTNLKSGFDIESNLLFKAGVFDLGKEGNLLLLTAHHLVVDGVSWRIILEDLEHILNRSTNVQGTELPLKTHSFMDWSNWLSMYAKSSLELEKSYWTRVLEQDFIFPTDFSDGEDTMCNSSTLSAELDGEKTTQLLTTVTAVYNIGPHEVALIALATVLKDLTGQENIVIELEGHGREEMDSEINLSRTVGWFTSLYPVHLVVSEESLDFNIKYLKEQLRGVPNKGIGFGILKYLKNEFTESRNTHIRFNYLGDYDNSLREKIFQLVEVDSGSNVGENNNLTANLDINAMILNGKLSIQITFSKNKFFDETVKNFLEMYLEKLCEIIEFSVSETYRKFTPSDFSASNISQDDLDSLFA
ncbi:MAG: amino acid adenylation domain-containing protein [Oscillospiraceae bacterium]|nr:amino acid adenylation domain-containing protein [Oscillospiraceae bacterium]